MSRKQNGFSALEAIIIVVIVAVIGVGGWMIYNSHHNKSAAKTPTTQSQQTATTQELIITEWGVKLESSKLPQSATYKIVTDNPNLKASAFLSTTGLDNSKTCQAYYTATAPSFQYIERYAPTDIVPLDEGQTPTSVTDTAKKIPTEFKVIDGYGYWLRHGNGMPCSDAGGAAALTAYTDSFASLKSSK